ncbi:MAG TPA: hypothetical protein VF168_12950, partial [Trueperaceae bacterium]
MSHMLLFGAGASVEAGLPTAVGLTEKVLSHFNGVFGLGGVHAVLDFVHSGLKFEDSKVPAGRMRGTLSKTIDIERLLNVVGLIASRHELDLEAFISSWQPSVQSLDYPRGSSFSSFKVSRFIERLFREIEQEPRRRSTRFLESDFQDAVRGVLEPELRRSQFERTLTETMKSLQGLLRPTESVDYLDPLADLTERQGRLVVATLNYDPVAELYFSNKGIPVSTGVEKWSETFDLSFPDTAVSLIKLHGSLNWELKEREEARIARQLVVRGWENIDEQPEFSPAIIFGQRDKLSTGGLVAEGPFL